MTYTFQMKVPHAEGSPEADAALKKFKGVSGSGHNRSQRLQPLLGGGRSQILCTHLLRLDSPRYSPVRLDP